MEQWRERRICGKLKWHWLEPLLYPITFYDSCGFTLCLWRSLVQFHDHAQHDTHTRMPHRYFILISDNLIGALAPPRERGMHPGSGWPWPALYAKLVQDSVYMHERVQT